MSRLESFYQYIFTVVGWYYTSWGILQVKLLKRNVGVAVAGCILADKSPQTRSVSLHCLA